MVHLSGIFVSLTWTTARWSASQWATDIASMKGVGMTFFVLPHPAFVTSGPAGLPDSGCPLGHFSAYFDTSGLGPCFTQLGPTVPGGTAMIMLAEAAKAGMRMQMGLALSETASDPYDAALVPAYAALQRQVAHHLWSLAAAQSLTSSIAGFYTEIEEYNAAWWLPHLGQDWAIK